MLPLLGDFFVELAQRCSIRLVRYSQHIGAVTQGPLVYKIVGDCFWAELFLPENGKNLTFIFVNCYLWKKQFMLACVENFAAGKLRSLQNGNFGEERDKLTK